MERGERTGKGEGKGTRRRRERKKRERRGRGRERWAPSHLSLATAAAVCWQLVQDSCRAQVRIMVGVGQDMHNRKPLRPSLSPHYTASTTPTVRCLTLRLAGTCGMLANTVL